LCWGYQLYNETLKGETEKLQTKHAPQALKKRDERY
jgi:hypothetical protein